MLARPLGSGTRCISLRMWRPPFVLRCDQRRPDRNLGVGVRLRFLDAPISVLPTAVSIMGCDWRAASMIAEQQAEQQASGYVLGALVSRAPRSAPNDFERPRQVGYRTAFVMQSNDASSQGRVRSALRSATTCSGRTLLRARSASVMQSPASATG